MAYLKSKTLFFTTSPRTPLKMITEIQVLHNNFEGKKWNTIPVPAAKTNSVITVKLKR